MMDVVFVKESVEDKIIYYFRSFKLPDMKLIDYMEIKKSSEVPVEADYLE